MVVMRFHGFVCRLRVAGESEPSGGEEGVLATAAGSDTMAPRGKTLTGTAIPNRVSFY